MNLTLRTLELLRNRSVKQTFLVIEEATGLKKPWLDKFCSGQTKNPSANRMQILYDFLSKTKLEVL